MSEKKTSRIYLVYKIYLIFVIFLTLLVLLPGAFDSKQDNINPLARWIEFCGNETPKLPCIVSSLWEWKWEGTSHLIDDNSSNIHLGIFIGVLVGLLLSICNLVVVQGKLRKKTPFVISLLNFILGLILIAMTLSVLLPQVQNATMNPKESTLNFTTMGTGFYLFVVTVVLNLILVIFSLALIFKRTEFPKFLEESAP